MTLIISEHFPDEIAHLKPGDDLALWTVPDLEYVNAYRPGTDFGQGLAIRLLKADNPWVADRMRAGLRAWLHIDAFDGRVLSVTAHAETEEDHLCSIQKARERYRKAIETVPRKLPAIQVYVASRLPSQLIPGWRLPFIPEPIDHYVNNTWAGPQFIIPKYGTVAYIRKPSSAALKVLQAHFHGYRIRLEVIGESEVVHGGNRYSYWDEIMAPAKLEFDATTKPSQITLLDGSMATLT